VGENEPERFEGIAQSSIGACRDTVEVSWELMEDKLSMAGDIRPIPDPTLLTTLALDKGLEQLKQLLLSRINAMEKAQELFEANLRRVPTEVDREVARLKELVMEKFHAIDGRFMDRDERVKEAFNAARQAIEAALASAKEASRQQTETFTVSMAKSEASASKQIDQQGQVIQTSTNALNDKIGILEGRMTRMEAAREGAVGFRVTQQSNGMYLLAAAGFFVTLISVAFAIYAGVHGIHP